MRAWCFGCRASTPIPSSKRSSRRARPPCARSPVGAARRLHCVCGRRRIRLVNCTPLEFRAEMQFSRPYLQQIDSIYIARTATSILPLGSADTAASVLFWRKSGCKRPWRPFWIDFRVYGSQSRLRVSASGQTHSFILWNGFLYVIDRPAPRLVCAIATERRPDSYGLRGNAPSAPPIPAQGDRHRPVLDGAGDSPVLRVARRDVAVGLGPE